MKTKDEKVNDDESEDALLPAQVEGATSDWVEDEEQETDPKNIPF